MSRLATRARSFVSDEPDDDDGYDFDEVRRPSYIRPVVHRCTTRDRTLPNRDIAQSHDVSHVPIWSSHAQIWSSHAVT